MYQLIKPLNKRIAIIIYCIIITLVIIVARLFYLQINLTHHFVSRSEHNFLRIETTQSPRGNILDCNGVLLATNRPITDVYWQGSGNRMMSKTQLQLLQQLGRILNKPITTDHALIQAEKYYRRIAIARDIAFDQLSQIVEQFPDHTNITLSTHFQRHYPHTTCASHIVGYLGRSIDTQPYGQMGLEKLSEHILKGKEGAILKTINSVGTDIDQVKLKDAHAGDDINTTIDIRLQQICERIFPEDHSGAFILMNPDNGALHALVSRPAFDPSIFLSPISKQTWQELQEKCPFLNRAFNASYPPGSIFKLVTISAALEHNIISPDSVWDCKGYVYFARRKYWCHRRQGHGQLITAQAVAQSCNVLFYEIGKEIDIDLLADYAHKFGLGQKTTILFPEKNGIVPSRQWKKEVRGEPWWPGETLSVTIGQSFLLSSPIQIARMIASIFTGYLITPRILIAEPIKKQPLAIKPETLAFLKKSMHSVVKRGTGKRISTVKDITIFAKTSTAQTSSFGMRRLGNKYLEHAWFVAYFQYKDNDPIIIVILVENAGTSQVATTIAKNFLVEYKQLIDRKTKRKTS